MTNFNIPLSEFTKGAQFRFIERPNSRFQNHHYQAGSIITVWEMYKNNMCVKTDDCRFVAIEDLAIIPATLSVRERDNWLGAIGTMFCIIGLITANPLIGGIGMGLVITNFLRK